MSAFDTTSICMEAAVERTVGKIYRREKVQEPADSRALLQKQSPLPAAQHHGAPSWRWARMYGAKQQEKGLQHQQTE